MTKYKKISFVGALSENFAIFVLLLISIYYAHTNPDAIEYYLWTILNTILFIGGVWCTRIQHKLDWLIKQKENGNVG